MDDFFRLSDAAERGLTRAQLRTPTWVHPSHGLYGPAGSAASLPDHCRALRHVLPPGAAYSHLTLATLLELWLPRLPDWLPIQATLPPGAIRPERRGLWVARSRARLPQPILVNELPAVPTPVMIGQLAEDLALIDLVVAIDCVLYRGWCCVEDIRDAIRPRQRGAPRLREALTLADGRSESPWETILRLLLVLAGFRALVPQHEIYSATGHFVARGDIWLRGTRQISEYDGDTHRTATRHRDDLRREKALLRIGYVRYGYTKSEIVQAPQQIVRDAEDAYGLAHDPTRMGDWWHAFEESTLSLAGWNRFLRRLHRFAGQGGRTPRRRSRLRDSGAPSAA